jgi:PIN domain nuclease of toxin-antitoxin system
MNLLLDTCVLLWAAREPARLPGRVRNLFLVEPDVALFISVVSAWEISVKPALGLVDAAGWFRTAATQLRATILPIRLEHIAALQTLPVLHKDPFDRMLLAQAVAEQLDLVTGDETLRRYPGIRILWE